MKLDFSHIRGDLFGGITAGIVALPLALAFGVASGLGAAAGLYGAIALGIMAALFGGTPTQISGPTGPMTVVVATLVAGMTENPTAILATFVLAGVFQILMGIFKIGKYINYIPYPVVSGFMSGIGIIIIILQFNSFLGLPPESKITTALAELPHSFANANWLAVTLGGFTIAVVYLFPLLTKALPATLVALLSSTFLAILFKWQVPVIGNIPSGLPHMKFPLIGLSDLSIILVPALTLAALGSIDSLLTSLVADNLSKTRHDSNQELIGQGLGNSLAGLFGGIPGAGATMRTVVNIKSGGKTGISGAVHGLVLLAILLGLGQYAAQIPLAVLAGILITVGIGILDYKGLKAIRFIPKSDSFVMIFVAVLTVFVDLLQAVAVGMVISSLLFIKKTGQMIEKQAHPEPLRSLRPGETSLTEDLGGHIYTQYLDGPLFFGVAIPFQSMLVNIPDLRGVILHMGRVPHIDQSGLYALEEVASALMVRNVPLVLVDLQQQPLQLLSKSNLIPDLIPAANHVASWDQAKELLLTSYNTNTILNEA